MLKKSSICLSALSALFVLTVNSSTTMATEPSSISPSFSPAWTLTEGFAQPESVKYDANRARLYVSNVQGNPPEKDGKGYLSIVSLDGKLLKKVWVQDGLNAPKGMAIVGDTLYVSDVDGLVAIDINQGKVIQRHVAKDAKFLNDVTADKNGNVYVSDMLDNTIYCLCAGKFGEWVRSPDLLSPNGLLAEDQRLVIASWGIRTQGFETTTAGHLKMVTFADQKIASLGADKPVGNLDGLEADGTGGYYATDWMVGKLFHLDAKGNAHLVMELKPGSADHAYVADQKLLVIPMMNDNEVRAWKNK